MREMFRKVKKYAAGAALVVVSGVASATPPAIDVSEATGILESGNTAIATMGGAFLVAVATISVWRLLRGAAS